MMLVYMGTMNLANIDPEGNVEWLTTVDWREWHRAFTGDVDFVLHGQDNPTRAQVDLWWHWRSRVENAQMNSRIKESIGMKTKTFRLTVTQDEFAMDTQGPEARLMQQVSDWTLEQLRESGTSIEVVIHPFVWHADDYMPFVEVQADLRGPYWDEPCSEAPVLTREALENARDAFVNAVDTSPAFDGNIGGRFSNYATTPLDSEAIDRAEERLRQRAEMRNLRQDLAQHIFENAVRPITPELVNELRLGGQVYGVETLPNAENFAAIDAVPGRVIARE